MKLATLWYTLRPFFNIAHMANSIQDVDRFLSEGANAIEADITFDKMGHPVKTFHGFPCDCFRACGRKTPIDEYLQHIGHLSNPNHANYKKDYILQIFDLKLNKVGNEKKSVAADDLLEKILTYVYENGTSDRKLKFVFSLPTFEDIVFANRFHDRLVELGMDKLKNNFGWETYGNFDVSVSQRKWSTLMKRSLNLWQSDGITNCLPRPMKHLANSIRFRDDDTKIAFFSKVFIWTLDNTSSIRKALRLGVDAIMTNTPKKLKEILAEEEFQNRYRIATTEDKFWERHPPENQTTDSNSEELLLDDNTE